MGYLYLTLALLCGVIKGYCGKKTSGKLIHTSDAMLVNTFRMLFCILIGLSITLIQGNWDHLAIDAVLFAIAALSGVSTAIFAVSWILSVRQGAYMMVDVFLLIGITIPLILCRIIFNEIIRPIQWLGIVFLLVAGYIMCTYNTSVKGKITPTAFLLLVLCAFSNGIADFSQKLFIKLCADRSVAVFNLYSYLFAALTLAVCCAVFRKYEKNLYELQKAATIVKPIIGYVFAMAVCLFLNSYFKTLSAQYLTAVQIYPLNQGGSVILSMAMSSLLFREKINTRCIVGVAVSFAALILINVF